MESNSVKGHKSWKEKLYGIIFETNTPAGKAFDIVLVIAIILSVVVVALESYPRLTALYGFQLRTFEWIFTGLFTVEYILRLASARKARRYAKSFFGVIDFLAVVPTYLSFVLVGTQVFLVIRVLRLFRLFRIFKIARYMRETEVLRTALVASKPKITIFIVGVFTAVIILGSAIHLVEPSTTGFENIPASMYWAVVTVTTVGYGDVVPITALGKAIAGLMIGYRLRGYRCAYWYCLG